MGDLVSAIITTYKRDPDTLGRAIKSVLNQTYQNLELIVVDDSPCGYVLREDVRKTVQSFGNKVTYIPHETNRGACVARNTGLAAAAGDFVAFLDDDDEWVPTKIEKQLAMFTDEDIALVYCGNLIINDTTGQQSVREVSHFTGMVYEQLVLENFIGSTSFPLIRKSVLQAVGGFDPLMKSAQDYDVWLRISAEHKVAYVNEPLVVYHIHDGEQISKSPQRKIDGLERFNTKCVTYLDKHPTAWWVRHMKLCPEYARNGQLGKALSTWLKAAFKRPGKVVQNGKYFCLIWRGFAKRGGGKK